MARAGRTAENCAKKCDEATIKRKQFIFNPEKMDLNLSSSQVEEGVMEEEEQ